MRPHVRRIHDIYINV